MLRIGGRLVFVMRLFGFFLAYGVADGQQATSNAYPPVFSVDMTHLATSGIGTPL